MAKIKSLFESACVFPHAPPHAEEFSARLLSNRDIPATLRSCNIIRRFNGGMGYLPGYSNETETREIIRLFLGRPELAKALRTQRSNLERILSGEITEEQFATRLIKEDLLACMDRVVKQLDLTEFAKENEIFHLGRRDAKNLASNFEQLNLSTEGVDTFLEIQKKYNLGPHRLSRIPPEEIFEDKFFFEFLRSRFAAAGIDIQQIPKGDAILKSHHQKQVIIDKILKCMEEAGYNQEEKNHSASLTGRMHDASHAIYASSSNYFVTNDKRFSKKVIATYIWLRIPTKILNIDEFVKLNFSRNQSTIELPSQCND
nr:hypothetical protein [uncultured Pseudomonas sp.]